MDQFYKELNVNTFKKWVYYQVMKYPQIGFDEWDEQTYKLYCNGKIGTFEVWPNNIIEETIELDDKVLFYLHYQFIGFDFAVDLFNRMLEQLIKEEVLTEIKVLICCTSGITSGFFAKRLNEFSELNHLNYHADFCNEIDVFRKKNSYDVVLFAPQVEHNLSKIRDAFNDVLFDVVDAQVFATYDCAALSKQIDSMLESLV